MTENKNLLPAARQTRISSSPAPLECWQALLLAAVLAGGIGETAFAADQASKLREIQEKLNADTINKPFDAGDPAALQAQLDEAVKKGIKPPMKPGPHWRPGYTCANLYGYYNEYYNCSLYYRWYRCYYC